MNLSRTFPKHLKNFEEGQKALPFLKKIKNNDEIKRVLRVYAKHVRTLRGAKYGRSTVTTWIMLGLQVIVLDLLKKSAAFWKERVEPVLFTEGLNFFECLSKLHMSLEPVTKQRKRPAPQPLGRQRPNKMARDVQLVWCFLNGFCGIVWEFFALFFGRVVMLCFSRIFWIRWIIHKRGRNRKLFQS